MCKCVVRDVAEVGFHREVLTHQAVGIFVGGPLVRGVGVRQTDRRLQAFARLFMASETRASESVVSKVAAPPTLAAYAAVSPGSGEASPWRQPCGSNHDRRPYLLADADTRTADAEGSPSATQLELPV